VLTNLFLIANSDCNSYLIRHSNIFSPWFCCWPKKCYIKICLYSLILPYITYLLTRPELQVALHVVHDRRRRRRRRRRRHWRRMTECHIHRKMLLLEAIITAGNGFHISFYQGLSCYWVIYCSSNVQWGLAIRNKLVKALIASPFLIVSLVYIVYIYICKFWQALIFRYCQFLCYCGVSYREFRLYVTCY